MDSFDERLAATTIVGLAMHRAPDILPRILKALRTSPESFPMILADDAIAKDESVGAIKSIHPDIRHVHAVGPMAITRVASAIRPTMPWLEIPYSSVMLSLRRGFFPKLFSVNPLYLFLLGLTERELLGLQGDAGGFSRVDFNKKTAYLDDLIESIESIWNLKFKEIKVRFGPTAPRDLLVTVSPFDSMVVIHPTAPLTMYWPGLFIWKATWLLLYQTFSKITARFKEQLSLLTVRALIGSSIPVAGTYHDFLSRHPVDHAQYQVEKVARELREFGDFNHEPLRVFPPSGLDDAYSEDMIHSLLTFLLDPSMEEIDERDLFARASSSSAGYKPFSDNFLLFKHVLPVLEKAGILEQVPGSNVLRLRPLPETDLA